jgi:hypothetical protein
MLSKHKKMYETPTSNTVRVKMGGVLCASVQALFWIGPETNYGDGLTDYTGAGDIATW